MALPAHHERALGRGGNLKPAQPNSTQANSTHALPQPSPFALNPSPSPSPLILCPRPHDTLQHVLRLVLVSVPFAGAPDALSMLLSGDDFDVPLVTPVSMVSFARSRPLGNTNSATTSLTCHLPPRLQHSVVSNGRSTHPTSSSPASSSGVTKRWCRRLSGTTPRRTMTNCSPTRRSR